MVQLLHRSNERDPPDRVGKGEGSTCGDAGAPKAHVHGTGCMPEALHHSKAPSWLRNTWCGASPLVHLQTLYKGDTHNELHVLKGPGGTQGVTGLRLPRCHQGSHPSPASPSALLRGQNTLLGSTVGWEVPLPFPSTTTPGPAMQGSKGKGCTLDAIHT